jgi:uncharacterized protein
MIRYASTLAAGAAGGAFFAWLGLPIPWLLGPIIATAGLNLSGVRMSCLRGGRQLGQILIGTVIGLYFTPKMAVLVAGQLPWMLLVALVTILLGGFGAWVHHRLSGLDTATAFFGSVPGGMAEMMNLGDRFGAEPVALTLSQTIRVTIVVMLIPAALTYFGEHGSDIFVPAASIVDWHYVPLLLGGAILVSMTLSRLGVTNGWMLGACAFTASLTFFEIELSAMPTIFIISAQVLIGASLGERFQRDAMARAPLVILGSAITTIVMMLVAAGLALGIAAASGVSVWAMLAAASPGGLAEMSITAQVLDLGVPLVTAYHVVRIFMITLITLPMYRLGVRLASNH